MLEKKTKLFFLVNLLLFVISVVVYILSVLSESFAEMYSVTVSSFVRRIMSSVTGIIPVSVTEILVVIGIPLLMIYVLYIIISAFRHKQTEVSKHVRILIGTIMLALTLFINNFGVCYHRRPLEHNLGLERKEINNSQLCEGLANISNRLENALVNVRFDTNGASVMPYSFNELSRRLDDAYDALTLEYEFITTISSPSKRILLSEFMTYTHISGIYMPLTGEANVNINYPDYVVAFSMAHEKAHQRGIAGEDEANFVAFLACTYSADDYIKYCGLMSMFDYYLTAAMQADYNMYSHFISQSSGKVRSEMQAYYNFFEKYRSSKVSKVAENVNDTYLKLQGQYDGTQSYGLVIELAEAYRIKNQEA